MVQFLNMPYTKWDFWKWLLCIGCISWLVPFFIWLGSFPFSYIFFFFRYKSTGLFRIVPADHWEYYNKYIIFSENFRQSKSHQTTVLFGRSFDCVWFFQTSIQLFHGSQYIEHIWIHRGLHGRYPHISVSLKSIFKILHSKSKKIILCPKIWGRKTSSINNSNRKKVSKRKENIWIT